MRTICPVVVCLALFAAAPASAQPCAAPLIERHVIAQASIGQPGRERAFLNIVNPDQVKVVVSVQFVRGDGEPPITRTYEVREEDRRSIELAREVPELGSASFFSIFATPEAIDTQPTAFTLDFTLHRAADFAEITSRTATVRCSPKR